MKKLVSILLTSFAFVFIASTLFLYQNCSKPIQDLGEYNGSSVLPPDSTPAPDGVSISITNASGQPVTTFYSSDTLVIKITGPSNHHLQSCLKLSLQSSCSSPTDFSDLSPTSWSCTNANNQQVCTNTSQLSNWGSIGYARFVSGVYDLTSGSLRPSSPFLIQAVPGNDSITAKINGSAATQNFQLSSAMDISFSVPQADITWECVTNANSQDCDVATHAMNFHRTIELPYACTANGTGYNCVRHTTGAEFASAGNYKIVYLNDISRLTYAVYFNIIQ